VPIYLREILDIVGGNHLKLALLISMFFGASLLDLVGIGLIVPYVTLLVDKNSEVGGVFKYFVDFIGLSSERRRLMIDLGIALITIFFLKVIINVLIQKTIITFCQFQQVRLRSLLMKAYQEMPYGDILKRNTSTFIHETMDLTGMFSGGVLLLGLKTIGECIAGFLILLLLIWHNYLVVLLLLFIFGGFFFVYDRLFRTRLGKYGQICNDSSVNIIKGLNEGIAGLKEIRIFGKESHFHKVVYKASEDFAIHTIRKTIISNSINYVMEFLTVTFVISLIFVNLYLGEDINKLLPTLALFAVASVRLKPIVSLLSNNVAQLRYNRDGVSRLHANWLMLIKSRSLNNKILIPALDTKKNFKKLTLQNICFSYPEAKVKALEKISLEIKAGESIGLIGPSGSGKTTLVDILLGLLVSQKGELFYNGELLNGALREWRSQVAYVPQQVFLLDNSLRRNVALGFDDAEIDELLIRESLRQARLEELVAQLPKGIDTVLGERGVRLSGGQRQRVALARAFYHGRNVLILDEATSALDQETEFEITEEIKHLKGIKTLIVIAHRLTTVQHCDRIYRLDEGSIIDSGTPQNVLITPTDLNV
jgi:ATP-binding cassette, subfamily B, bacterial PglK